MPLGKENEFSLLHKPLGEFFRTNSGWVLEESVFKVLGICVC